MFYECLRFLLLSQHTGDDTTKKVAQRSAIIAHDRAHNAQITHNGTVSPFIPIPRLAEDV